MEKYNLTQTGLEVQEILDNATPQSELTTETQRAQLAEQTLQGNIDAEAQARANAISTETQRAQLAEQTLQTRIDNEALTRANADTLLQTNIGAEETRAKAAEKQNADDIDALEALLPSGVSQSNKLVAQQALEAIIALIPSAASALNQLADKAFVNSSIATNTATFRGTFNLVSDLHLPIDANHETIALNLLTVTPTADNNDFCYVQIPDSAETPTVIASTDRYKFNGTEWGFEYTLNTSGFTSAQWDAINSGITAAILESLTGIPALIPSEATDQNQLADKAYVLTQILLATPAFKGQFTTLTQLQAVTGAKAGDLGIVRTKDTDGHDVFAFYQYKNDEWTYFYSLSYHPQDKPATTGLVGEAPYNGMGRVELPMNWVEGWPNDTWLYYPYNDVVYLMYYWNGLLYAPYNSGTQEGLGLDDNLVVKPLDYNIADIEQFVGQRYLPFTESSGVWTITKPNESTITSTELNNTNIYKINDPTHLGINVLTQAMLNRPNTIYVIQYDFTLGEDITVPSNCILEFDGGSISGNVTLIGNNTIINGGLIKIFETNVSFSGSWKYSECYPEWWGAKGDDINDDTNAFHALAAFVTAIDGSRVFISKKTYLITAAIYFKGNIEFCGVGADSVLHLGNSNTGIHFGEENDYTLLDSYLTDGDGTITGKTINDDEVTCKSTVKGDRIIKVSNASAFVVNELYVIQDTCDFSFDNTRAYYRQGEIIKIKSVDTTNNTITLYNGLCGIYGNDDNFEGYVARENIRLFEQRFITCLSGITHRTIFYKYNFKQVNLHNFKIRSEGNNTSYDSGYYALSVYNVIHSKIDSIEITSEEGSHVSFRLDGAYKSSILNSKFHTNFTTDDDLYGAVLGDIQDVLVSNCTFGGIGHSLATGSKPDAGAIVNRNFIYERLSFDPIRDPEDSITLDVHAGSEYYTYKNIFFPSGACDLGGYNVTVENCVFRFISTSFHRSGLTIRNTECLGIGSLLDFLNPWHDYSNDEILIEDCKTKGGHNFGRFKGSNYSINFTSELPDRSYPINNLIIRNSIIEDGIFIRYKLANTIIIENNIVSLKDDKIGISIYERRNYNNNNYIIIRNNKIIQNFANVGISIDHNIKTSTNVEEIAGNLIFENNYIQSNVYTRQAIFIGDIYNGVIKGNQVIARGVIVKIEDSNCGFYNNILISDNVNLSHLINVQGIQNHYNIDFDDSNIINDKYVELGNYQTNKYRVHYGYSDVRNHMNLFAQDEGYGFFDLDLNKTVKVHFTNKSIIKDDFFPTGDADGVFVPNDLVDGAIYNLGLRRKSDFYLAKTNINPKEGDLKPIFFSWSNGWNYQFFKNEGEYPYLYFVNTRYEVGDSAQYRIYELDIWKEEDGASAGVKRSGTTSERPTGYYIYVGFKYMDTTLGKPIFASAISEDTVTWVEEDGVIAGTLTSGTFANKPTVAANNIPVGFKYFCTDKQTTEGATNGIEIIHKGNNVWVDALGRVVS